MDRDSRRTPSKSARRSLHGARLFASLAPHVVDEIAEGCVWQTVAKGRELFGAGVGGADVYFVVDGSVRVTTFSAAGREVSFRELGAGSAIGTVAAIDGQPRSASVVAIEDATIAVLPRERFLALLTRHPPLALAVLADFAGLIRGLTNRVVATTTATIPIRVRRELLELARTAGVAGNRSTIAQPPTHADFATRIGATREAVTRELNKLTRDGLLAKSGKALVITDVGQLEAAAEDD
jgi:CRP-like cAMP-binding protein